jgi:hypothetical protein
MAITSSAAIQWWRDHAPSGGVDGFDAVVIRRSVTNAELLTLFASPITLVAANANYAYVPTWMHVEKPSGTASTVGTMSSLDVLTGTKVMASVATGIVGTGPQYAFAYAAMNATPALPAAIVTADYNTALTLKAGTAAPTGGSGNLNVTVRYLLVPKAASSITL